MPPYGYKRINSDGSRNVWCPQCRKYIATVNAMSTINTAICVICQLENDGVELTPEQTAELRGVRVGEYTLSQAAATPPVTVNPMAALYPPEEHTEVQTGRVGYFVKALVNVVLRRTAVKKNEATASKQIAKEKKRSRIFDLPIDEE